MVNFFFLTHALLPHHHHNGIPHFSFLNMHSHDEDMAHHDDCCCPDEPLPCEDTCALDRDIDVIVSNDEDSYLSLCCSSHSCNHDALLQAVLLSFLYDFSLPDDTKPFRQPPYLISTYQEYVNQSSGLRAPPVA